MAVLVGIDVSQLVSLQIGDRELAEDIVEDRGRVLDLGVAADETGGLEAGEGEGLDELIERNAVLQADRDGDGEIVHERAEGGAFLVHVEKDLAEPSVVVLAGMKVDLMPADHGLLDVAGAAVGKPLPPAAGLALGPGKFAL